MLSVGDALKVVADRGDLTEQQINQLVGEVLDGQHQDDANSPLQLGALLVALRMKGETVDELLGAARAMRQRMLKVQVRRSPLLDTCGTGGSGLGTFNISTAVAFVCAAAGVAVAKHGNRAITSRSGSADVLAALGVGLDSAPDALARSIEDPATGVAFLFAPQHHAAMRHVGAIRKGLGVRTLFNLLGPLTNPAAAQRQLMGVFSVDYLDRIAQVLGKLGSEFAWVVHGDGGADELTLSGLSQVAEWDGRRGSVRRFTVDPRALGLDEAPVESLAGGTADENAKTMRRLLGGKLAGPLTDAVILNAAAALLVAGATVGDLSRGVSMARELLAQGAPLRHLDRLVAASRAGT